MPPIATIPAASPSSPSTKFTALIDATSRNAVIAIDRLGDAVSRLLPNGNITICSPPTETRTEIRSWPAILSIQSRSAISSMIPRRQTRKAPRSTTQITLLSWNRLDTKGSLLAKRSAAASPISIASPPIRGVGTVCTSRERTSPTAPQRMAIWRTRGVTSHVTPPAIAAIKIYTRIGADLLKDDGRYNFTVTSLQCAWPRPHLPR